MRIGSPGKVAVVTGGGSGIGRAGGLALAQEGDDRRLPRSGIRTRDFARRSWLSSRPCRMARKSSSMDLGIVLSQREPLYAATRL